jgi:hypothetical protein
MTRKLSTAVPYKGIPSDAFLRGDDFLQRLREAETAEQKRALVAERNPFLYALGIGGHRVSNKTVPKTRQA